MHKDGPFGVVRLMMLPSRFPNFADIHHVRTATNVARRNYVAIRDHGDQTGIQISSRLTMYILGPM
jgi:hypothetical protein